MRSICWETLDPLAHTGEMPIPFLLANSIVQGMTKRIYVGTLFILFFPDIFINVDELYQIINI